MGASAGAGLGAGTPGLGAAGRATCAGEGAAGFAGVALRGAPGLAADLPALPAGPCKASVNLRTTGASIVEDAERTNSPSSWSLAMTTLLSTPNSLASSYTRTLATSLLLGPGYRRTVATSWAYSSRTHRVLIAISTYFQLARYLNRTGFRAVLLLALPPARDTGAIPRCRAVPEPGRPGGTPGGGPPDRDSSRRGADTHPGRAAYRVDREHTVLRSPRCAADRSWPLVPDSPRRFAQGRRGHLSGQTQSSLPPRTDLTPLGQGSNTRCIKRSRQRATGTSPQCERDPRRGSFPVLSPYVSRGRGPCGRGPCGHGPCGHGPRCRDSRRRGPGRRGPGRPGRRGRRRRPAPCPGGCRCASR